MRAAAVLIEFLSSAMLFLVGYALAPWPGNLLGGAAVVGVPVWTVCVLLAGGLATDAVLRVREMRRRLG